MTPHTFESNRGWPLRLVAMFLLAVGLQANAQLVLTIVPADQVGLPGQTFLFSGTVTNETGASITTPDLFLDFSNFDPAFLAPVQLLGSTFASIADGATSPLLSLFELTLAAGAVFGPPYGIDVLVQDADGSLSDPVTATVSVVPEPSISVLLLGASGAMGYWSWRRRTHRAD